MSGHKSGMAESKARDQDHRFAITVHSSADAFLGRLGTLWDQFGLSPERQQDRYATVESVLQRTFTGMIDEEEGHIAKMVDTIERHGKERTKLIKELGVVLSEPAEDLRLIQLEHFLRCQCNEMREEKTRRMEKVLELKAVDEQLCADMAMEPHYISASIIPTSAQMESINEHIQEMKTLKKKRFGSFMEMKLSIVGLYEQLEVEPRNGFEREVVCEEEKNFILSAENLLKVETILRDLEHQLEENKQRSDQLREKILDLIAKLDLDSSEFNFADQGGCSPKEIAEFERQLSELEIIKGDKMEMIIKKTREQLVDLWTRCYYSKAQRSKFQPFSSTEWTDEVLEQHENEVNDIRCHYEANADLFAKVAKRQELWKTMLELNAMQKDPQHLMKAKGKDLLIEERNRKRVNKQLPKVEEELAEEMAQFSEINGHPFFVGGVPYDDFVQHQVEEYKLTQEAERETKKAVRKKNNVHETIYGSKPVTPAANRTLALKRKAGENAAALLSSSKRHRTDTSSLAGSSAMMRSPHPSLKSNRTIKTPASANMSQAINKSKFGFRRPRAATAADVKRKVLGDRNNDSMIAGFESNKHDPMSTIDSERFLTDMPNALTSTFQMGPSDTESPATRTRALITPSKRRNLIEPSTPTFKTPNSRVLTPANRSGKKMTTLRSGRALPFLM